MRAFVTGGSGFIGANLIRQLIAEQVEVRALARPDSNTRNLANLPIEIIAGSLNDVNLLSNAMKDCDWVFHVAAHYSLCRRDANDIYQANVTGTKNILTAAGNAQVKKIIYTSSVSAIGLAEGYQEADEKTQTTVDALVSDYKRSKFLAEEAAHAAVKSGLPVVIVNPSTPIGPLDIKPTPTGEIILKFLRREMPFFVHTGLNLIDVRDVVKGHILAAERGRIGERYILGNENLTLKDLLDKLARITGLKAPSKALPHWIPVMVGYIDELVISRLLNKAPTVTIYGAQMAKHPMYYNSSKAVKELGLPQNSIDNALQDAVNWFKENRYV